MPGEIVRLPVRPRPRDVAQQAFDRRLDAMIEQLRRHGAVLGGLPPAPRDDGPEDAA